METPVEGKSEAEARDYLAEERTFLAWIRTSLGLMGFGFVVARAGLTAPPNLFSLWIGAAFIAVGVAANLLSIRRHLRLVGELNRGQLADRRPSREAIILALFLALIGAAMALFLTWP